MLHREEQIRYGLLTDQSLAPSGLQQWAHHGSKGLYTISPAVKCKKDFPFTPRRSFISISVRRIPTFYFFGISRVLALQQPFKFSISYYNYYTNIYEVAALD